MEKIHIKATRPSSIPNLKDVDSFYTRIHLGADKVKSDQENQALLMAIKPKTYTRSSYKVPMPTRDQIENELRVEAKMLNFDKASRGDNYDVQGHVTRKLPSLVELRQKVWQDAKELYDKIEDAREERTNAKYADDYQREYNKVKGFLQGDEDVVSAQIQSTFSNVKVPYNIELSYEYNRDAKLMDVDIVLEDGIVVPTYKTVILRGGKITIKDKLQKEVTQDKTYSAISILFYMTSKLFTISPNIRFLQISMYVETKQSPILWICFDRERFSEFSPKMLYPLSETFLFPHVFNLKTKRGALELNVLPLSKFESEKKQRIVNKGSSDIQQTSSFKMVGTNQIAIGFDVAQKLCEIPYMSNDVQKAISIAHENGWLEVKIDKKYRGIVSEIDSLQ